MIEFYHDFKKTDIENNFLHQNVCPEGTITFEGEIKGCNRNMLCMRWGQALRNRQTGAGFKPPLGAAVKSCGIERKGKRLRKQSGGCQGAERK